VAEQLHYLSAKRKTSNVSGRSYTRPDDSLQDIRLDLLAHPPPVHLAQCGSTLHMICIDFVIVQRCPVQTSELQ